jgi:hypothetical protein
MWTVEYKSPKDTEWKQYGHVEFMNLYRAVRTVILAGIAQPQFLYRMTQVY